MIAEHAASRSTIMLPTATADPLAAAIVVLDGLHRMQLGPEVHPESVADAMDQVAEDCSPFADVLPRTRPRIWPWDWPMCNRSSGAARFSLPAPVGESRRRCRAASGRAALAADAEALLPILESVAPRDPFADPFEDQISADRRPTLVLLDDGNTESLIRTDHQRLAAAAERNDIRVCPIAHWSGSDVERYATLLQTGMFAAVYLAVGLGRSPER